MDNEERTEITFTFDGASFDDQASGERLTLGGSGHVTVEGSLSADEEARASGLLGAAAEKAVEGMSAVCDAYEKIPYRADELLNMLRAAVRAEDAALAERAGSLVVTGVWPDDESMARLVRGRKAKREAEAVREAEAKRETEEKQSVENSASAASEDIHEIFVQQEVDFGPGGVNDREREIEVRLWDDVKQEDYTLTVNLPVGITEQHALRLRNAARPDKNGRRAHVYVQLAPAKKSAAVATATFCPSCGADISARPNAKFCTKCGAPLRSAAGVENAASESPLAAHIRQNYTTATKVKAIAYYREQTGAGLAEAKRAVERILEG